MTKGLNCDANFAIRQLKLAVSKIFFDTNTFDVNGHACISWPNGFICGLDAQSIEICQKRLTL
jgi:hypothetical protein